MIALASRESVPAGQPPPLVMATAAPPSRVYDLRAAFYENFRSSQIESAQQAGQVAIRATLPVK